MQVATAPSLLILAAAMMIAGQAHPHPSSALHSHAEGKVLWEFDGSLNGDVAHNHMKNRYFGGWGLYSLEPYSAYGCWDNGEFRYSTSPVFLQGHCYVDSFDISNPVTYSFEGPGWDTQNKDVMRLAFSQWSSLATFYTFAAIHGVTGNTVGIDFNEVSSSGDLTVAWSDLGDDSSGSLVTAQFTPSQKRIEFNDNNMMVWDFTTTIGQDDDSKWHFLTTALHEIGHAVGLIHQANNGDVMQQFNIASPVPNPDRNLFYDVDLQSAQGVYELYGQPQPQASPPKVESAYYWCQYKTPQNDLTWWEDDPRYNNAQFIIEYQSGSNWYPWYEGVSDCLFANGSYSGILYRVKVVVEGLLDSDWVEILLQGDCVSGGGGPL